MSTSPMNETTDELESIRDAYSKDLAISGVINIDDVVRRLRHVRTVICTAPDRSFYDETMAMLECYIESAERLYELVFHLHDGE